MAGKTKTILIADHPILSKMWDIENNTVNAIDFGIGNSTRDFAWICPKCHKPFIAKANSVVNTGLCPECAYKEGAKKRIERKLESGKYTSVADDVFLSKYWAKDLNSVSSDVVTNGANKKYCGIARTVVILLSVKCRK